MLWRRIRPRVVSGVLLMPVLVGAGCAPGISERKPGSSSESISAEFAINGSLKNVQFIESYEEGLQTARRQGRPMLVFFTAEWCSYCHQMMEEALSDTRIVAQSQDFICVLVDADKEPEVCKTFQISGFPTVQFLSPQGTPLNRLVGSRPAEQVLYEMQTALEAVTRQMSLAQDRTLR
ncbi:Hypothetical protein PBC10988_19500 [Planctomycetales bacterium 10988]|nr:Hypothetical protein PBC10988_19500 [Planctomycetales bacterium 10988]